MLDTGYNHKIVYILGQMPVFELLGYFVRRKLRTVNKWLNKYVHSMEEDKAQQSIRRLWYMYKFYTTMCVSCVNPGVVQIKHLALICANEANAETVLLHENAIQKCLMLLSDHTLSFPIKQKSKLFKRADERIDIIKNLFYTNPLKHIRGPFIESIERIYSKERISGSIMYSFELRRTQDIINWVCFQLLAPKNALIEVEFNLQTFVKFYVNDQTTMVRLRYNLPIVSLSYTLTTVNVHNVQDCKCVSYGKVLENKVRKFVAINKTRDENYKFVAEEFNSNGVLVNKLVFHQPIEISGGMIGSTAPFL